MKKLNSENFENKINQEKGLFIIKFFSPTCGPCKTMDPVMEALKQQNDHLNVYEVDTMESPDLSERFGVRAVPYIAYCENREVLYDFTGLTPLADLQYVVDHIDDAYFRTHGEFKKEKPKGNNIFALVLVVIFLIFICAFVFI